MTPLSGRARLLVRCILVMATLGAAGFLASIDFRERISTNVMDLLPPGERDPELQLLRGVVDDAQARVVRVVLSTHDGGAPPDEAVQAFIETLHSSDAFVEAGRLNDPAERTKLGRFLFDHRFEYLLPGWLETRRQEFAASGLSPDSWPGWLADTVARRLEAFLARPESVSYEELVPLDPLLLLPDLVVEFERFVAEPDPAQPASVWARTAASPLSEAGQQPVFDALEAAASAAMEISPGTDWQWTGVHRFAAASKHRIQLELGWLNTAALVTVVLTVCLLVRRPWQTVHLLPIVLLSMLTAWVVALGWFNQVHILVFVLGALLCGAAVDFGFHLGVHAAAGHPWRSVMKPLLASCLTTVFGFALLGITDLPLLRQLSVFVCAGLLGALIAAVLYVAQRRSPGIEARPLTIQLPRMGVILLAILGVIAAAGMLRIEWRDDIRDLQIDDPELRRIDADVRAHFGESSDTGVYLVHARDPLDARNQLQHFVEWHRRQSPDTPLASAALLWPAPDSLSRLPGLLEASRNFPDALRAAFSERGFVPEAFAPFFDAWDKFASNVSPSDPLQLWRKLEPHLPGPLRDTVGIGEEATWLTVAALGKPSAVPPDELQVIPLNRLESLNHVFQRYRHQALRLSLAGLGVLGILVLLLYGPAKGVRVFAIPAGATAVAFGVLGWLGEPLNLFHLLGAFLGVCLSHDYAIFGEAHRAPGAPAPASVRLSALTTAASFGVLAFSRINAVSALGLTVTLIVLPALVIVEARSWRQ